MMGGPIDLTPFGTVVQGIGILYWVLAIAALFFALKRPKTRGGKAWATLVVLVLFGYMPAAGLWNAYQARSTLNQAMALFQERCKTAGEKIHRTVENVEGVVWMKWRPDSANQDDQFRLDDPYGHDCGGKDCIASLLQVTSGIELNPAEAERHRRGYRYVESIDPTEQKVYRYVGVIKLRPIWTEEAIAREKKLTGKVIGAEDHYFAVERQAIANVSARYGVTWNDISTREDRERWIAGSSLRVIDLQSNEVIAERVGYMIDRGQGSRAGFRSPWAFAPHTACPEFDRSEANNAVMASRSRFFIYRVLKFKQGD